MKCYIATKLENHEKHNEIRDKLQEIGIECTYDWTVHGAVYMHGKEVIRETADKEHFGIKHSDFVVVILPGGRGTHVELGMAIERGLPVILYCETEETQHMMEAVPETCAFYHMKECIPITSLNQLCNWVTEYRRKVYNEFP